MSEMSDYYQIKMLLSRAPNGCVKKKKKKKKDGFKELVQ